MATLVMESSQTFAPYSLKWDGSFLGKFPLSCKLRVDNEYPYSKVLLNLAPNYNVIVRMHTCKNSYSCIVDELNPVFGKVKIGTHTLKIGTRLYTIYNLAQDTIVTLKDINTNDYYTKQSAQDAFVFRVIVGLTIHAESALYIRDCGVVTSFRNRKDEADGCSQVIPMKTINKWFVDDYESSISRMVANAGGLHKVRPKVQKIINRLDPGLIYIDHLVYDNITKLV